MGIYDRSYIRDDAPAGFLGGLSMTMNVVLFTAACYVAQLLFPEITGWFALKANLLTHPWRIGQLVTYGFMHDPNYVYHIAFNMFGLWFFGREVEVIYGPREFLRLYLTLIVMSGLVWALIEMAGMHSLPPDLQTDEHIPRLLGASGGVMGIAMVFTLHFPRRLIYIWGVLPIPVWMLMALEILGDFQATRSSMPGDNVAHIAHLAGVLFGLVYYRSGWNLGRMLPDRLSDWFRRPRLKLHAPEPDEPVVDLSRQVDQILEKISRQGESSLTAKERQTLEEASRRYQRRRQ